MYKYKLVIFDLDGTLINSVLDLAIATNYALQHYGHPQHPEDKYRYFVGNGVDMLLY
ncbi:MAG: HAD hydrolase-like protein, partial [Bacteroidetes bacterium]|nr:HAD hydrolase-like protein [Bacteroidota bacterium]